MTLDSMYNVLDKPQATKFNTHHRIVQLTCNGIKGYMFLSSTYCQILAVM